jgi:hypothetical protein
MLFRNPKQWACIKLWFQPHSRNCQHKTFLSVTNILWKDLLKKMQIMERWFVADYLVAQNATDCLYNLCLQHIHNEIFSTVIHTTESCGMCSEYSTLCTTLVLGRKNMARLWMNQAYLKHCEQQMSWFLPLQGKARPGASTEKSHANCNYSCNEATLKLSWTQAQSSVSNLQPMD